MSLILVVDDDADTRVLVRRSLEAEGFAVQEAEDGLTTLAVVDRAQIDAVVLDVNIGQPSGLEVCRKIRESRDLPVLLLSGRASESDELMGLAAGASDYIAKPFNPRVLSARVASQLSKRRREEPQERLLRTGGLAMDEEARSVWVAGREARLTRIEFDLLALLMSRPHKVFTRQELLRGVWTDGWYGDDHLLETHTSRLRRKIRDLGGPTVAVSVRGIGYRLTEDAGRPPELS